MDTGMILYAVDSDPCKALSSFLTLAEAVVKPDIFAIFSSVCDCNSMEACFACRINLIHSPDNRRVNEYTGADLSKVMNGLID